MLSLAPTKGLLNEPGQNSCFLNSAVQVGPIVGVRLQPCWHGSPLGHTELQTAKANIGERLSLSKCVDKAASLGNAGFFHQQLEGNTNQ